MPPSISVATNAVILIVTSPEGLRTEFSPLDMPTIRQLSPFRYWIESPRIFAGEAGANGFESAWRRRGFRLTPTL